MRSHLETQAAFRAGLTTQDVPTGVTAVGDVPRRFSVYRNTVAHSLSAALTQRFPVVNRIVGQAFFKAMAQTFVAAHPPRCGILHDYGTAFPEFLKTFPPAKTLPYLPDTARIEVLRGQAYHAADASPLSPADISAQLAEDTEGTRLAVHPSVRVISSAYPVVSIWSMNQPGAVAQPLQPAQESALIFRRGDDVIVLTVTAAVANIITALSQGAALGAACHDASPDSAAAAISLLMQHGLIVGLTPRTPRGTP